MSAIIEEEDKSQDKKLHDSNVRSKLGMNAFDEDDSLEERKQQKYKHALNHSDKKVESRPKKKQIIEPIPTPQINEDLYVDSEEEEEEVDESESVLSDISDENIYFKEKLIYQRRALFRKNVTLQWRQRWTNIWQLVSPIMGLLIVVIFKEIGIVNLLKFSDKAIFIPFPQLFGLNMKSLATLGNFLKVSTCNQWYMYEFDKDTTAADREFFGYNEGDPWTHLNSSGMLNGKKNVLSYACNEINKTVPYFKEFTEAKYAGDHDMSDYLSNVIRSYSKVSLDFTDRDATFPELNDLPDGTFRIREANSKRLSYNMQLNDLKYWQYHRNNGVTKIGVNDPETNTTFYNLRSIEGALTISDIMNQAYMRTLFNDTTVIGGV